MCVVLPLCRGPRRRKVLFLLQGLGGEKSRVTSVDPCVLGDLFTLTELTDPTSVPNLVDLLPPRDLLRSGDILSLAVVPTTLRLLVSTM